MPLDTGAPRAKVDPRQVRWKVVETSTVTDESLEWVVNEWVRAGWTFEGIQFAMRESSKRPAMAFVLFTRPVEPSPGDAPADGGEGVR